LEVIIDSENYFGMPENKAHKGKKKASQLIFLYSRA